LTDQENVDLRPYFREEYIQLIEVDRDIAERANDLCRTDPLVAGRKPLRPNDAIHVASAERAGCNVILAYDPDFSKYMHEKIQIEWPIMIDTKMLSVGVQGSLALSAPSGIDETKPRLTLYLPPKSEQ
jgi:PIN domain